MEWKTVDLYGDATVIYSHSPSLENGPEMTTGVDNDFAPLDQQEDIDDLPVKGPWFSDAVLWSADWTTETIVAQLKRGNINLNPNFQRRSAWTRERKSRFIESLILGLPIPQIILAEDKNSKGKFIVIDGKQRLLTIRQFTADIDDDFERFDLRGLEDRPDLNKKYYLDLKTDLAFRDDIDRFDNQTIRTVIIRGWGKEEYLYSVFLRINQGSLTLSPQELRQAIHPGPFSTFIDERSAQSEPLLRALGLDGPDFRMRDAELLLRYFAYKFFASDYVGNLKVFLDKTHINLNKNWKEYKENVEHEFYEFEETIVFLRDSFGEDRYFRKWNGSNYEKRINRAVFDIMMYYFSNPHIRLQLGPSMHLVEKRFRELCEDRVFLSSIEQTTKSKEANRIRFGKWVELLNTTFGLQLVSPFA